MAGPIRMALELDLEKLESKGILEGRDALVTHARILASRMDKKPSTFLDREFREVLDALGIGRIVTDSNATQFNELMERMFAPKDEPQHMTPTKVTEDYGNDD